MRLYFVKILSSVCIILCACTGDKIEPVNHAPVINSIISDLDSVQTLSAFRVTCNAFDPDGDSLVYIWSFGGSVVTDSGSNIKTIAPRFSTYLPVTCMVSDLKGGTDSKTINLKIYGHSYHIFYSAEDSSEAGELALWLGKELTYSQSDFHEVLWSLNEIRYFYHEDYNFLTSLRFQLPWLTGEVIIRTDSLTSIAILSDQYSGWNLLNEIVQPESIEMISPRHVFHIKTGKFQNSWALSKIYLTLPGIEDAHPNYLGLELFNIFYPICPVYFDGKLSYIFSWDKLYYFDFDGEMPKFIGIVSSEGEPDQEWLNRARDAMQNFQIWGQ